MPTFVTGAVTDHLTPWKGCYRTTQLLGGEHVRAEQLRTRREPGESARKPEGTLLDRRRPGRTQSGSPRPPSSQGTWWEAWIEWFEPHGGGKKKAPRSLGNKAHPVVDPAPGRYVHS